MLGNLRQAALLRPMFNVGCLMDVPSGRPYVGKYGETITNGGEANFDGIVGMPNLGKTGLSLFIKGTILSRYVSTALAVHDTENTLNLQRLAEILFQFGFDVDDLVEAGRLAFSDAGVYIGNEWFEVIKGMSADRRKDPKLTRTTPFYDHRQGEFVKVLAGILVLLDSLSGLNTDAVERMFEKGEIGEKELNMVAMRGAMAKSQMIDQMINVTSPGGIFLTATAHVGQEHQLDQYKPPPRKLRYMKQGEKIKKIPENFLFLTHTTYQCTSLEILLGDDKKAEFPHAGEDEGAATDLNAINVLVLRCKSGMSGYPFKVVVSQSEGIKVGLTEYLHLKEHNYFGLSDSKGNSAKGATNFRLDLLPEVNLTRRSIRDKIDEDKQLQRALTFSSELQQIRELWTNVEPELFCKPKELYEDLTALGYDWKLLFNTRGYWIYKEDETEDTLPFLSTMDLMKMRVGLYHPYWYPKKREEMNLAALKNIRGATYADVIELKPTAPKVAEEQAAA